MKITIEQSPQSFRARANPFLRQDPCRNQLVFELAQRLESLGPAENQSMWIVENDRHEVQGIAIRTNPQRSLVLSAMDSAAVEPIVDHAMKLSDLDGVLGVKETAEFFQQVWQRRRMRPLKERMNLRLYDLTTLRLPKKSPGSARPATSKDLDLLAQWSMEFGNEALGGSISDPSIHREATAKGINEGRQWVWEVDNELVAMTIWTGKNEFGTKITGVYTPVELRGRGYASNLVAAVTDYVLKEGAPRALIYTDLKNPTSNSIYQNIGYRHVCDYLHWAVALG